jgi:hypothetical protein
VTHPRFKKQQQKTDNAMATISMPFELAKPDSNTPVTRTSEVWDANDKTLDERLNNACMFFRIRKLPVSYKAKRSGSGYSIFKATSHPQDHTLDVGAFTFPLYNSDDPCPHIILPSGMIFVRYCAVQGSEVMSAVPMFGVTEITDTASWQTMSGNGTDRYVNTLLVVVDPWLGASPSGAPFLMENTGLTMCEAISEEKDIRESIIWENYKMLYSVYADSASLAPFYMGNTDGGTRPSGYEAYYEIPVTAETGTQAIDFRPLVNLHQSAHIRLNIQGMSYYETEIYIPAGFGFDVVSQVSLHEMNELPNDETEERVVTLKSNIIAYASFPVAVESLLNPNGTAAETYTIANEGSDTAQFVHNEDITNAEWEDSEYDAE